MKVGTVHFGGPVHFGAWGRNGRVLQTGLHATVLGDEIVIEPVTSKGDVSNAVSLRIPLKNRKEVIELLKSLD
jgi:hypothetical protein